MTVFNNNNSKAKKINRRHSAFATTIGGDLNGGKPHTSKKMGSRKISCFTSCRKNPMLHPYATKNEVNPPKERPGKKVMPRRRETGRDIIKDQMLKPDGKLLTSRKYYPKNDPFASHLFDSQAADAGRNFARVKSAPTTRRRRLSRRDSGEISRALSWKDKN